MVHTHTHTHTHTQLFSLESQLLNIYQHTTTNRQLKLNMSKTELLISHSKLVVPAEWWCFHFNSNFTLPVPLTKNFKIILDSFVSLKPYIQPFKKSFCLYVQNTFRIWTTSHCFRCHPFGLRLLCCPPPLLDDCNSLLTSLLISVLQSDWFC